MVFLNISGSGISPPPHSQCATEVGEGQVRGRNLHLWLLHDENPVLLSYLLPGI
jgi:hypothetical protein